MVYVLLLLGLFLLAWGGDILVSGAVSLAHKLGVSSLLIGLALIGFGTSTPELLTSLLAVYKGSDGIAVGNIIGSNIANILLVLGAAAVIRPVTFSMASFKRDAFFLGLSSLLLTGTVCVGYVSFLGGVVLTGVLVFYVIYSYRKEKIKAVLSDNETEHPAPQQTKRTALFFSVLKTLLGIGLTLLGAKLLVDHAIILARQFEISEAVIGLTIVAVGTSLPELATSVLSAFKGANAVAFGNVVGSNIYNALFILGVTAIFVPVSIPGGLEWDIILMLVVTAVMIGIAFWRKRFSRLTGAVFLGLYVLYITYLF